MTFYFDFVKQSAINITCVIQRDVSIKLIIKCLLIKLLSGQLSQRMQIPGNVWAEVWQSARPVPAHRQRRLFDDTKEAEKVDYSIV